MSRHPFVRPADIPPPLRGALWMLLSAASFAVVSAAARHLAATLHPFEIAFFRTFFLLLFMLPLLGRTGLSALRTRRWGLQAFRSLASVGAMLCWFTALSLMPIAEVTALTFTSPLFSTIGAALILGERVGVRRWAAVLAGFAGTLVILRPGAEALAPGAPIALLAAVFMSAVALSVKSLSRTDPPITIVMAMVVLTAPLSLIPALFVWQTPPAGAWPWLALCGLGAVGVQMGFAKAVEAVDISVVLPVDFSRLIFAALAGFLVFGEGLDLWTAIGAAIIFAATLYTARRESRMPRPEKPPPIPPPPGR